jgi:hypothetical protein
MIRRTRSSAVLGLVAAAVTAATLTSTPAQAQNAIGLFKQGRALVEAGRWAEACPLFDEAHRLEPKALGILMNAGDCDKHVGKNASAWSAYQEAEFIAKRDGDREREQLCHNEAAALEPTLSRLRINTKDTPGLVIRRDDQEVGRGVWGTAFPVDPGPHKIEATAPGYSVWTTTLTIGPQRDLQVMEIPTLTRAAGADGGGSGAGLRTASFVVGGIGAAGLIVGGVFGGLAASAASKIKSDCAGNVCTTAADQSSLSAANSKALISTIGLAAGGGLLATGVVLFLVSRPGAPRDEAPRAAQIVPSFGPQGGSVSLVGAF